MVTCLGKRVEEVAPSVLLVLGCTSQVGNGATGYCEPALLLFRLGYHVVHAPAFESAEVLTTALWSILRHGYVLERARRVVGHLAEAEGVSLSSRRQIACF